MRTKRSLLGWLAAAGLLAALACGGQDSGNGGGEEMGGGVSAGGGAGTGADAGQGSGYSATGQSCLDLVAQGRFSDAIDPCTRAVRESPASQELAGALKSAQQGVAAAADTTAEGAKQAAGRAEAEADAARKAMEDMAR